MTSPERLTHRYGSRECMCVLRHLVMIAALMSNQWIPTTSLTTWTTMGMDNSSFNSATEVLVAESRNSGGMLESTVSYSDMTTSARSQLEPTTAVIPETTTSEPTTFVFPETTPETSTINSVITTTVIETKNVTGFDALKSASLTVPMTTTSNNSSPVLLTLHPTTTITPETTSTILSTLHSISSSTLSSQTNVTWSTATSATSGVNRMTNLSNVVTNETLGVFTSSVTSAVTSTPTTNMTSLGDSSDIDTTYSTNITSPESPTTITSTHSMANNATLRELTTLEFGLAVGFGTGGGFLLIVLFIIAVSCIIRRNRKRKRDTMSEEPYPHSPVKTKRKKRTRKRSASSPTVGVDNVRLSPVTYGKSPVQRLVDKNKNAKIRRNKRGTVQEITQAFAENEDVESTQKQIQTSHGNTTTGMPPAVATVVSETGNPIAGTNGLNNNNNNYDFVTGGIAVELKTTEHKPKRPGPSVKARPQTGVGLKLQASPPRGETNRTTSPISVPSVPSSPGVAEPLDDDEPFPPPPIVGYVNPTFEQFDPPIQGQKHLSDRPNRKVLLTQNSFGESQTDIDVQQNPLFGLRRVDK